ncbi:hypothetical protein T492DRAFT_886744 [Pavlovales sp. CCMP2436]|nr:hypothetical protein T492DRAFT_886744 [Pavlovales sp. CCMP2436]
MPNGFLASVHAKLGLEANLIKTVSYISPDHAAELDRVRVMYSVPLGFACSADGSIALSIKIYGIPLGSVEFVVN